MSINQLLSKRYGFYPVLIFDDLFSELDPHVNKKVLQLFTELKNQIFVTSADISPNLIAHGKTHSYCEWQPHQLLKIGILYFCEQSNIGF